ncbi:MAG: diguanylate cyclase [Firmicutes bacterium HGW-Firmicutes-8]|nr:MAG: diguanylate cyclase [Firmicutes bacterium HGW-Firmicutes-8]
MKIAIPDNHGEVNQHFGQSTSFAIIEIDGDNRIACIDTVSAVGLQHMHEGLAEMLKKQGVGVVIVGGIGQGAIDGLESQGLKVLFGASGSVKDVAETFARGEFVSRRVACNHHGGYHHHHHG